MYDDLFENDPKIKKMRAASLVEGEVRGRTKELRRMVVKVMQRRFPALVELARKRTAHINKLDVLDSLVDDIIEAPDEATARASLEITERPMSKSRRS